MCWALQAHCPAPCEPRKAQATLTRPRTGWGTTGLPPPPPAPPQLLCRHRQNLGMGWAQVPTDTVVRPDQKDTFPQNAVCTVPSGKPTCLQV